MSLYLIENSAKKLSLPFYIRTCEFKFKFNLKIILSPDTPEIIISPTKVFINSPPTQVKFNCSVHSYPTSDIIWIRKSTSNAAAKNQLIKSNYQTRNTQLLDDENSSESSEATAFVLENNIILNSELKYSIHVQAVNETFKQSSILIDIENEKDYGIYACFANNSAGSQLKRFYIYGGKIFIL